MQWINDITAYLGSLLENRPVLAVLIGWTFALAVTQWLKFVLLHTDWLPDPKRWIIRAIAMPIGALASFAAWPADRELLLRVVLSIAVGASAPYVYQAISAVIYKFWPDLGNRLSVNPYSDKPGD